MSRLKTITSLVLCIVVISAVCSFSAPVEATELNITIEHFAGTSLLDLDNGEYKNELGQVFTVSRFRYYVSNIKLKNVNGAEFESKDYFLVDEAEPHSKKLKLTNVPEGMYTSISFVVGVDSIHNCSGAQSGALDPVNGMYWAWNTGYIFLKLEGHANVSTSPGHIFEYHIGGYGAPNNCIRNITLQLGNPGLNIEGKKENTLLLKADILNILKGHKPVDFSQLSSVTDFHNATTIADNYADMFSIKSIQ
jgi:hypothetical protein